jgi:transposase
MLNAGEAAALLGCNENTVARRAAVAGVTVTRTLGGQRRYREDDIARLRDAPRVPPPRPPRPRPAGYLSSREAGERLGLSLPGVGLWIRTGKLKGRKGSHGAYEIAESDVEAAMGLSRSNHAPHRARSQTRRLVWELRDEGLEARVIAGKLGVSPDTVYYHLRMGRVAGGDAPPPSE